MVLSDDDDDDNAAAASLFLSENHLLFDNEGDCLAAIDDCEVMYLPTRGLQSKFG